MAKISVIVPVYGVEKYLRECIESILSQTCTDLEIILIDDGSKDSCPQIIDEYAKNDRRIIAIHKENGGYGSAMNVGLRAATGKYIGIVEPDDFISPKMYEDLLKIAGEFNSDIVKSCFYDNLQSKEEQRILKTKWDDDKIPQNRSFKITECGLFLQYHPSIWSCIYKKEFLDKHNIKFVEAPGAGWADNPFQVQTMCLAQKINYTPNAYYYWRRVNSNESDDLKDYTIPFKRTEEIHKWLNENNIDNEVILNNLYCRELAYISIVFGMKKVENLSHCLSLVNNLKKRIKTESFLNADYIKNRDKKVCLLVKKHPVKYLISTYFKRKRKQIISICLNKREKRIKILGKVIWRNYKCLK